MAAKKFRNYVFTRNNYEDTTFEDTLECKYIVYGKEIAPTTGTPHLQGTVCFASPRSFEAVRKLMGCHIEVCADLQKSITYCKEDGDWTERGVCPMTQKEKGESNAQRWRDIRLAAEEGRMDDIPDDVRFHHIRTIEHHRDLASKKRKIADTEEQHLWYYGASGTGKSRKAREENPDAYLKMCNKWWDGYDDEDVVIIEDFDKKHDVLVHHMKIWADRYPFLSEYKGGARKIRPQKIIVTSNYHPEEIWSEESDLGPILRRFKLHKFSTFP
ncbi:hypothetical protein [uncultured marine virus]|uniref:ATP-dependent helicase Rep n=1 Tax=uncultured marine virus TaxID=186617 RepID=S4TE29_9VIRU|nr:hypothetical protein [uncultured marine virus]